MVTLSTERLVLRPTDATDAEFLGSLEARHEVERFIGRLSRRKEHSHYFTVLLDGVRVAHVALVTQPPPSRDYEIVCAVLGDVEGRGIAREASSRVLQWAFDVLSLTRVKAPPRALVRQGLPRAA